MHKLLKRNLQGMVTAFAACAFLAAGPAGGGLLDNQGYVFLHPYFKGRPWKASLDRLDLTFASDSLASLRPLGFGVSLGSDSVMALLSAASGGLYCVPARYQSLVAPCVDHALDFGDPRAIALNGLGLPPSGQLYVVKDSLYSFDSIRVAFPVAAAPLRLLVATVSTGAAAVTAIDTLNFVQQAAGQNIGMVSGTADPRTGQDNGLWVTGAKGLIRHVPYAGHRFGAEVVRDLAGVSETVLCADSAWAGTSGGKIYKWSSGNSSFQLVASAAKPVWRVYRQGAVGGGGLFKENNGAAWKNDTAFGTANYRFANFIRRPGGFGVELLDSAWKYSVFTYRDTASQIGATAPDSLLRYINGASYRYGSRPSPLSLTLTLNDPDSNFSDYRISLNGISLTNDGKYTIQQLSDSADCQLGKLRMTSGRVRLTLSDTAVLAQHDCALGALDPACLACYWKPYTLRVSKRWERGAVLVIQTASQILRIVYEPTVTNILIGQGPALEFIAVRFPGSGQLLYLPCRSDAVQVRISVTDLQGRLLYRASVAPDQRLIALPSFSHAGVVIFSAALSDGTTISRKIPTVP